MKPVHSFLLVLLAVVAVGFAGYAFGFLGFVSRVMMPGAFGEWPLPLLAVLFGIAAFFSPCSFTVLPAYVSYQLTGDRVEQKRALRKGLSIGFRAALGVLAINLVIGIVIAALGSAAPFAKDPREDIAAILWIRIAAGLLIAILGAFTALDRPLPLPAFLRQAAGRLQPGKSSFLYGMLYSGAAIGCTGPLLLGLTLYALTVGSFAGAFATFAIFALTMGALMIALTIAITVSKEAVMRTMIPMTPVIKKMGGWLMVFVGLTIAFLTMEGNNLFVKIFFPFLP